MSKAYMVLYLDGLLQSYGTYSTEKYKGTEMFPTKSAVIAGILGSSFGYSREDRDKIAELSSQLKMGVRRDRFSKTVVDFQVVSGVHKPAQDMIQLKKKVSKKTNSEESQKISNKVVYKSYLSDAAFTVVLEGDYDVLKMCEDAIKNPKWVCTLGRYNCIPSVPIFGTIKDGKKWDKVIYDDFDSLEEALSSVPLCANASIAKTYLTQIEADEYSCVACDLKVISDEFTKDTLVGTQSYGNRYVYLKFVPAPTK